MSNHFSVILAEDEPRILQFMQKKIEELDPRFEIIATARNGMAGYGWSYPAVPHEGQFS